MIRLALLLVLIVFLARAFWRLVDGVIEGVSGRPAQEPRGSGAPARVQMQRDPVCGTFVIPDQALSLGDGRDRLFFCSARCRDAYRTGAQAGARRSASAGGRTA